MDLNGDGTIERDEITNLPDDRAELLVEGVRVSATVNHTTNKN